jgi:hypothetical protein
MISGCPDLFAFGGQQWFFLVDAGAEKYASGCDASERRGADPRTP